MKHKRDDPTLIFNDDEDDKFYVFMKNLVQNISPEATTSIFNQNILNGIIKGNVPVSQLLIIESSHTLPVFNRFLNTYQMLWRKLCLRDFGFDEIPSVWGEKRSWRSIYAWHSYYFRRALRALMRYAWNTEKSFDFGFGAGFVVDDVPRELHMLPYEAPGSIYYVYCDIPNRKRRYFDANHLTTAFFHTDEIDDDGFIHRKDALYWIIDLEAECVSDDPIENAYRSWYAETHTELLSGVYNSDWKTILATLPEFPQSENGRLLVGTCQTCHYDRATLECSETGIVFCDSFCQRYK